MPHIQKLYEKYSARDLVVLTVNYSPDEKDFVPGFLQAHHYTFPALESPSNEWEFDLEKAVGKQGLNFIVDRYGRVMFAPSPDSKEGMETLENELSMLLEEPKQTAQEVKP